MTNATTPTPGNEIRVKCAEAMGWSNFYDWDGPLGRELVADHYPGCTEFAPRVVPAFDTHWDGAAELLVEALRKEGWRVLIDNDGVEADGDFYTCRFIQCGDELNMHSGESNSLPLAICLAFLATKGLEP